MPVKMVQAVAHNNDASFLGYRDAIDNAFRGRLPVGKENKGSFTWTGVKGTNQAGYALITLVYLARGHYLIGVRGSVISSNAQLAALNWGDEFRTTGFQSDVDAFRTVAEVRAGQPLVGTAEVQAFFVKLSEILFGPVAGPNLFAQVAAL